MAGTLIVAIVFCFWKVSVSQKHYVMSFGMIFAGICAILSTISNQIYLTFCLLSLIQLGIFSWSLNVYSYINVKMNPKLYAVTISIVSVFCSLYTPVFSGLDSIFKNWKMDLIFCFGIPAILAALFFLRYVKPNNEKEVKENIE